MERSGSPHGPADTPRDPALPHGAVELDDIGVLRIHGADAEPFLQGQLSNDVTRLAREGSLLAGFHNPQGRAIALLHLVQAGDHDILALLPRALAATVAQRLSRFILRAKVRIADESTAWRVRGLVQPDPPAGIAFKCRGEPVRWIAVAPVESATRAAGTGQGASAVPSASGTSAAPSASPEPPGRTAWRLLDIAAGVPQILPATSELFVAQMLNLDAIDAISFSKGCYTGQEVIARAHYRGRVKRRMQRWRTLGPAALAPGDSALLPDGRALRVVDAAPLPNGRCELLAVGPLTAGADDEPANASGRTDAAARAQSSTAGPAPAAGPAVSPDRPLLEAESLPLPYDVAS